LHGSRWLKSRWLLAHEVQEIVPEAISGTKDAMTAEVFSAGDELREKD
jgi:hypothetical protein